MSATMNGSARRPQLSDQVVRLDDLLDRLERDLPATIAEAVRDALAELIPALAEALARQINHQGALPPGYRTDDPEPAHRRSTPASRPSSSALPAAAAAVARATAESVARVVAAGTAIATGAAQARRILGAAVSTTRWWLAATRTEQVRGLAASTVGVLAALAALFSGPTIATTAAAVGVASTCWAGMAAAGWPRRSR